MIAVFDNGEIPNTVVSVEDIVAYKVVAYYNSKDEFDIQLFLAARETPMNLRVSALDLEVFEDKFEQVNGEDYNGFGD